MSDSVKKLSYDTVVQGDDGKHEESTVSVVELPAEDSQLGQESDLDGDAPLKNEGSKDIDGRDNDRDGAADDVDASSSAISPIPKRTVKPTKRSRIRVTVRVRPMNDKERDLKAQNVVHILNAKVAVLINPKGEERNYLGKLRKRESRYTFDHVFDNKCSQQHVFNRTAKALIPDVCDGFNATVFAYGQTGSGKTYTMLGKEDDHGVMMQTLIELFQITQEQPDRNFKITMSYLEVYNENIRDLLGDNETCALREDPIRGVQVAGITEVVADSAGRVMDLLQKGNGNRTTEPTAANKVSSRSHAVLQISVESKGKSQGTLDTVQIGKLSLIDLAGSERASNTQNRGMRMVEGASINRSLLALANCINALASKSKKFVPYRDSKLTRLLKDSLGGNTQTVMITCISPASTSHEETHNSLKYANRAKNIRTRITQNVMTVAHHITQYTNIIEKLRLQVHELQQQLSMQASLSLEMPTKASALRKLKAETQEARKQIKQIFEERRNIVKSLINVQQQKAQFSSVISNHKAKVQHWEKHRSTFLDPKTIPNDVQISKIKLQNLAEEMKNLDGVKTTFMERLKKCDQETARIRKRMSTMTRATLQLEYDSHRLGVRNIILDGELQMMEKDVRNGDILVMGMEEQIRLRDKAIAEHRELMRKEGMGEERLPPIDHLKPFVLIQEENYARKELMRWREKDIKMFDNFNLKDDDPTIIDKKTDAKSASLHKKSLPNLMVENKHTESSKLPATDRGSPKSKSPKGIHTDSKARPSSSKGKGTAKSNNHLSLLRRKQAARRRAFTSSTERDSKKKLPNLSSSNEKKSDNVVAVKTFAFPGVIGGGGAGSDGRKVSPLAETVFNKGRARNKSNQKVAILRNINKKNRKPSKQNKRWKERRRKMVTAYAPSGPGRKRK
mmetsp:Transcript_22894/g.46002  ORF Transcript_22894/g.46002 Transcript_22894/m.46002 type:complete len:906 (+) Transcript_22894:88-2805(+)